MKLKIIAVPALYIATITSVSAAAPNKPPIFPNDLASWQNRLTFSGGANVGAFVSDYTPTIRGVIPSNIGDSPAASDVNITFATFGVDAKLAEWLSTKVALSYGQQAPSFIRSPAGGGSLFVDQAFITVADPSKTPFYFIGGRKFLNFGGLDDTSFLESPYQLLTLNRQTLLSTGFTDLRGFNASAYVFRGLNNNNSQNTTRANNYGFTLGFAHHNQSNEFDVGAGYISDLLNGLYPSSTVANSSTLNNGYLHNTLPAIDLHAKAKINHCDASVKYASALKNASVLDVPFTTNGGISFRGAKPAVWGVNGGYTFNIFSSHQSRFGVGYQGSSESAALGRTAGSATNAVSGVYGTSFAIGMPQKRYYTNYTVTLVKWAKLGFEYADDVGYSVSNGGTGRAASIGVAMLSATF